MFVHSCKPKLRAKLLSLKPQKLLPTSEFIGYLSEEFFGALEFLVDVDKFIQEGN
jgi:hypothetical protein